MSLPGSAGRAKVGLLLVFALLGLAASLMIPVGAGFDEEQHLRRVWEMAHLHLVPNSQLGPDLPIPAYIHEASYREQPIVRTIPSDFWTERAEARLDDLGWIYDDAQTRSVYSPVLLLPQSVAFRYLGLKFNLPGLQVIWGARLAGLAAYVVLVYLAVRFIPYGKWLLLVLALSPTALFQAATVSADTLTNGFGLLFIAGILALAHKPHLTRLQLGLALVLVALLFQAKINMAPLALLPLLLLSPSKVGGWRNYVLMAVGVGLLFTIEVVGWHALAYPAPGESVVGSNAFGQLEFIARNPLWYAQGLVSDLIRNGADYLTGWAAAYGYYYWPVPSLTYIFYAVALIAALVLPASNGGPTVRGRLVMVLAVGVTYVATAISLQLTAEPVGSQIIHELHGRYFTPILPLVFLALLVPSEWRSFEAPRWMPAVGAAAGMALFVGGIGLVYHVPCGSSYYRLGHCYQPQYKNWAPGGSFSRPVEEGRPLRQEFVAECDGLSRVRLWVDASRAEAGAATRFEVGGQVQGRPLQAATIANDQLPTEGWVYIDFEPVVESRGKAFWVRVSHEGAGEGAGPRLGMTIQREYERGVFYQGGEESKRDLFFQYGCVSGLERLKRQVLP